MFKKIIFTLGFLASIHAEYIRPCDLTDLECIRTILETVTCASITVPNGANLFLDAEQVIMPVPYYNTTFSFDNCAYSGYSDATIYDFYQTEDDEYTVLTVNIPKLIMDCGYSANVTVVGDRPSITTGSFDGYDLGNVALTTIFSDTESTYDDEIRTFAYIATPRETAAENELETELNADVTVFYREAFALLGKRVALGHFSNNLGVSFE